MSNFVLSQILAGIAICTDIMSFQLKERHKIVTCLMVSALLISTHFMLLGHWTAAGLALLGSVRFATSIFTTSKKIMVVFMVGILAITQRQPAGCPAHRPPGPTGADGGAVDHHRPAVDSGLHRDSFQYRRLFL